MELPRIDLPTFECKIYSKDTPLKFRPFTVKEKKILLIAVEANDINSYISAMKQIIHNCVLESLDVENLPLVDMEILFLNLKARSEGEITTIYYNCLHEVLQPDGNTKPCGMVIPFDINLLTVDIKDEHLSDIVKLTSDTSIKMKYPTFSLMNQLATANTTEAEFVIVLNSIDYIVKGEELLNPKDALLEERIAFLEQLPTDKYDQMKSFLENTPTIYKELQKTCPNCGFEHKFALEGLADFFL